MSWGAAKQSDLDAAGSPLQVRLISFLPVTGNKFIFK
jgi:hypothetical protein